MVVLVTGVPCLSCALVLSMVKYGMVGWKMLSLVVAMVKVVNDVPDPPEHPLSPPFGLSFINP